MTVDQSESRELTAAMFPPPAHPLDSVFAFREKSPVFAPVRVGMHVLPDGSLAEFLMPMPGDGGRHVLAGGSTGSGKSRFLRVLLAEVAPRPDVAILLQDPKRVEFSIVKPRATTVAKGTDSAILMLERLVAEMERRYRLMEDQGVSTLEPGPGSPYLLAVFDEFAALSRNGTSREVAARHDKVEELAQMGRACCIGLVVCTQRPSADAVPMSVRDQMRVRVAFGCESWQQSNMILGDGTGKRADNIPPSRPGWAYVKVDRAVEHIRSYDVPDAQMAAIAAKHAALRVDLPGWPHVIDPTSKES